MIHGKLVSVIVPAYNSINTIITALDAIRCQTYSNLEILVVDDCSTDGTKEVVIRRYSNDKRFRVLRTESNSGGAAVPRNIGIKSCVGEYVAFCDSDDVWFPEKIERQIATAQQHDNSIICTSFSVVDADSNKIGSLIVPSEITFEAMLKSNWIGLSTALIPSKLVLGRSFSDIGHEDYLFWLTLLRDGADCYGISEILSEYRILPNSLSRNKFRNLSYLYNVYRVVGIDFIHSSFYTFRYALLNYNKYKRSQV